MTSPKRLRSKSSNREEVLVLAVDSPGDRDIDGVDSAELLIGDEVAVVGVVGIIAFVPACGDMTVVLVTEVGESFVKAVEGDGKDRWFAPRDALLSRYGDVEGNGATDG